MDIDQILIKPLPLIRGLLQLKQSGTTRCRTDPSWRTKEHKCQFAKMILSNFWKCANMNPNFHLRTYVRSAISSLKIQSFIDIKMLPRRYERFCLIYLDWFDNCRHFRMHVHTKRSERLLMPIYLKTAIHVLIRFVQNLRIWHLILKMSNN